jgi:Leucine-rich repeat (LRR) protein
MKNYGINTPLINDYFTKCKEKLKIKSLNLSNNKITDIQVILNECLNLEALMVSKNFIKTVKITKPLKNLTKFVIFSNKLTEITGFSNT